ncbi:MAG: hypothetical protein GY760_23220 [Deltaproteobacteria bacterium]|nr:hypothetical protein [Deltaproteobacteria bacterium]
MNIKKSAHEWKILVDQYKDSGLSVVKFSQKNNLKPSTLTYWLKKYRSDMAKSEKRLVRIAKPVISEQKMILSYNGIVIEIPSYTSTKVITSLIASIREN